MKEVKKSKSPNENAHMSAKTTSKLPQINNELLRCIFFSLINAATGTSNIDTNEVMAAKNTNKKKMLATALAPMYPKVSCNAKNICGKYEKIIDIDDSLSSLGLTEGLKENIAGKIIRPAVKATAVSVKPTNIAEVGKLDRLSI